MLTDAVKKLTFFYYGWHWHKKHRKVKVKVDYIDANTNLKVSLSCYTGSQAKCQVFQVILLIIVIIVIITIITIVNATFPNHHHKHHHHDVKCSSAQSPARWERKKVTLAASNWCSTKQRYRYIIHNHTHLQMSFQTSWQILVQTMLMVTLPGGERQGGKNGVFGESNRLRRHFWRWHQDHCLQPGGKGHTLYFFTWWLKITWWS